MRLRLGGRKGQESAMTVNPNPGQLVRTSNASSTHLVWNVVDVLLDLGVLELSSDETFRRKEGVFRVDDRLSLGWETDELEGREQEKGAQLLRSPQAGTSIQPG